jgi:hypothetical protein
MRRIEMHVGRVGGVSLSVSDIRNLVNGELDTPVFFGCSSQAVKPA